MEFKVGTPGGDLFKLMVKLENIAMTHCMTQSSCSSCVLNKICPLEINNNEELYRDK